MMLFVALLLLSIFLLPNTMHALGSLEPHNLIDQSKVSFGGKFYSPLAFQYLCATVRCEGHSAQQFHRLAQGQASKRHVRQDAGAQSLY